jgi:hypothetical protein
MQETLPRPGPPKADVACGGASCRGGLNQKLGEPSSSGAYRTLKRISALGGTDLLVLAPLDSLSRGAANTRPSSGRVAG